MNFEKEYIIQCVKVASSNLRLNNSKIEVVTILSEYLNGSNSFEEEIYKLKKITEFSTLGIKIGEIHKYLLNCKIEFINVSDIFKGHTELIVTELQKLLDKVSPEEARLALSAQMKSNMKVDLNTSTNKIEVEQNNIKEVNSVEESERIKEKLIMHEVIENSEDMDFENFEEMILAPIQFLDALLNRINEEGIEREEIENYIGVMKYHANIAFKMGFDIVYKMHKIFAKGLELKYKNRIESSHDFVEAMRACLIVIVAIVKNKDVDINSYLLRANNFGEEISNN